MSNRAVVDAVQELTGVPCTYLPLAIDTDRYVPPGLGAPARTVDVASWSDHKAAQLFAPSDTTCAGRLIAGDGVAYVTDTAEGRILELDLRSLEIVRVFDVGGRPRNLTLARR